MSIIEAEKDGRLSNVQGDYHLDTDTEVVESDFTVINALIEDLILNKEENQSLVTEKKNILSKISLLERDLM